MSDKQILVIVVDPAAKSIEADTIDDNLASMQKMVGGNIERVFATLGDPAEVLWCDDAGKLKDNHHFHIKGHPDIITGRCFICREMELPDDVVNDDTQLDVAAVQGMVTWLPHLDGQQLL